MADESEPVVTFTRPQLERLLSDSLSGATAGAAALALETLADAIEKELKVTTDSSAAKAGAEEAIWVIAGLARRQAAQLRQGSGR